MKKKIIKNYTMDDYGNDILILLSGDISDKDKIKSIKMFVELCKHMKKNGEM